MKSSRSINSIEVGLIQDALKASCMCATCSQDELDVLSEDRVLTNFKEGQIVCKQDSPGTHFFVVCSGSFQEIRTDEGRQSGRAFTRQLTRGSSFGELALIQDGKNKAMVTCIEAGGIWLVDGKTFRKVLSNLSSRHADEHRKQLSKVNLFEGLSDDQCDLLVAAVNVHSYKKGVYVVREGDSGEGVFIVKEGELKVSAKGKELRRLRQGQYFGESALLHKDALSKVTVVTLSPATCLSIGRLQLQEVLRIATLERLIFSNFITTALTEAFWQLTTRQIEELAEAMEQHQFEFAAEAVVHDVTSDDLERKNLYQARFLVVLEGAIDIFWPNMVRRVSTSSSASTMSKTKLREEGGRLERGDCFGREYVLQPKKSFQHDVRCVEVAKASDLKCRGHQTYSGHPRHKCGGVRE